MLSRMKRRQWMQFQFCPSVYVHCVVCPSVAESFNPILMEAVIPTQSRGLLPTDQCVVRFVIVISSACQVEFKLPSINPSQRIHLLRPSLFSCSIALMYVCNRFVGCDHSQYWANHSCTCFPSIQWRKKQTNSMCAMQCIQPLHPTQRNILLNIPTPWHHHTTYPLIHHLYHTIYISIH